MEQINIYCDESCHLQNDKMPFMVLGAVWCPRYKVKEITNRINEIKEKHGLKKSAEIKWVKVSPSKIEFYKEILNYFFDNENLHFRGLVADKKNLKYDEYKQSHDDWYYRMYFTLLKIIFNPIEKYRIYLDIKDTRGGSRVSELHEILCNKFKDYSRGVYYQLQLIRSNETSIIQITDLINGALSYSSRDLKTSPTKMELIDLIKNRSGLNLTHSTFPRETKFNLFFWSKSKEEMI